MVVLLPRGFADLIAPERITAWLDVQLTCSTRGSRRCHVRFAQKATEIVRRRNMSRWAARAFSVLIESEPKL
jgi:hypothetical protein